MANVESISNASWNSYNAPPRTLDTARTTESGSGGKLNSGRPAAAPARMKRPANGQIR